MHKRVYAQHGKDRLNGMISAALELLNTRTWSALARLTTLACLLALPLPTQAEEAPAPAPSAPAAPAGSPMAGLGEPTQNFGPTASRDWVDRLTNARRRVRDASAASDAANEAYARALFAKTPEGPELDAIRARREQARKEYADAMNEVPALVGQARDAGVSPRVLKLYENSMPR